MRIDASGVSNAPAAQVLGSVSHTNGEARYLAKQGDLVYVSQTGGHFYIYDVSVKAAPVKLGTLTDDPHLDSSNGVTVSGDFAYVAVADQSGTGSPHGMCVIDVSKASTPTFVTFLSLGTTGNGPMDIAIDRNFAYVVSQNHAEMYVVDIENPRTPVLVATLANAGFGSPQRIHIRGKYAWIAGDPKLVCVDISNPYLPVFISSTALAAYDLTVGSRYLYCTEHSPSGTTGALDVVDIKNPAAPVVVGRIEDPALYLNLGMWASGNYAYCVQQTFTKNFTVVDLTNPASPKILTSLDLAIANHPYSVIGDGRYVYFTNYILCVIDTGQSIAGGTFDSLGVNGSAAVANTLTIGDAVYVPRVVSQSVTSRDRSGVSIVRAGLELPGKTGAAADGDYLVPRDQLIQIDNTPGSERIAVRVNGGWKYVALS